MATGEYSSLFFFLYRGTHCFRADTRSSCCFVYTIVWELSSGLSDRTALVASLTLQFIMTEHYKVERHTWDAMGSYSGIENLNCASFIGLRSRSDGSYVPWCPGHLCGTQEWANEWHSEELEYTTLLLASKWSTWRSAYCDGDLQSAGQVFVRAQKIPASDSLIWLFH